MGLIDLLLNVAGVLLWLPWCAGAGASIAMASPATLVSTLQPAKARGGLRGWELPAGLIIVLVLRAVLYWRLGAAVEWTPRLDLVVVTLAFRGDVFGSSLLFSCLSFARALIIVYFWLLVLSILNRNIAEKNPVQRLVRLYFGKFARWPWPVQALSPVILVAALWVALHPLLLEHHVVDRTQSAFHLLEQGLIIGGSLFLSLKCLFPALLLLYLVASYAYVGASPFWDFVSNSGKNLLTPFRWIPLRFSRLDLTPLVAAILILLLLHTLPTYLLHRMTELQQPFWPQ